MILRIALLSLRSRLLATVLTVISIALSVALLLLVEQVRTGMRESFSNTVSGTDLIVGSQVGPLQLVLFTVFGIGGAPSSIDFETFERYRDHPAVAWAIPVSLGDSHRGFRVFGTNEDYFEHFRFGRGRSITFASGRPPRDTLDAVVGDQVARDLGYSESQQIVITHGLGDQQGILDHEESPFTVVGVLEKTGTPIDRTIYVTLEGVDAMHESWPGAEAGSGSQETSAPDEPEGEDDHEHGEDEGHSDAHEHGDDHGHDDDGGHEDAHERDDHAHAHDAISAFFVGVHSRVDSLRLQREMNEDESARLVAILPAVALSDLWRGIDVADSGLRFIVALVVLVGLVGMLVSLLSTLEERRREMAVLRAVGARPRVLLTLLTLEATALTTIGVVGGLVLDYAILAASRPVTERMFGLVLPMRPPSLLEWTVLATVILLGMLIGLVPAVMAYRRALADGLAPSV